MPGSRSALPHWPTWVGAAILVGACLLLVYEVTREYFPRFDLPAFDAAKAQQLDSERRATLERELFSELPLWNRESGRYRGPSPGEMREDRWRAMAGEGLELAHIALQVLQPERGSIHPLTGPMARLEELAKTGDTGAMCLMTALVDQAQDKATEADRAQARRWLKEGAQRGHPECSLQLGRRLILGLDGHAPDLEQGISLEFRARQKGYAHDLNGLITHFQRRWSRSHSELTRLYCWLSVDTQSRATHRPRRMLENLRREARREDAAALLMLADELERTDFSMKDCVDMGFD